MTTQTTTVHSLRAAPESQLPIVAPGFGSLQGFELMQRAARLLSSSTLVPVAYRQTIEKLDRFGNVKESRENPNALANSVVALNMAQRMGADPLMVMQNLYIVEGRPSWSSQWIIAAINGCGRFSPLRFRIESRGERDIEFKSTYWENNQRHTKVEKVKVNDKVCVAWAIEKETGEVIESPAVSIEMAVLEGWYTKNGSKWQTMDEVMLRYRTASFFGKLYAPELLMGLQTVEEAQDIIEATTGPDGTISVNVDELRGGAAQPQRQTAAADVTDVESRDTKSAPDTAPAQAQAETGDRAQTAAPDVTTNADPTAGAGEDDGGEALDPAKVEEQLRAAKSLDVLDIAADYLPGIADIEERDRLNRLYQQLRLSLTSAQQRAPRRRVAAPE
ncbi:hypothetical protein [Achromobacter sp.]|uniref:hypothetical protein n=1 Tax=Achromobacter sp. TaxID=134375 RepID=UPI000EDA7A7B|nr:hypothetical protein [Achromobacter sp.]HCW16959.1 hypothetical protein [Achromobacter sp.]